MDKKKYSEIITHLESIIEATEEWEIMEPGAERDIVFSKKASLINNVNALTENEKDCPIEILKSDITSARLENIKEMMEKILNI
jgi:hypothetical protein